MRTLKLLCAAVAAALIGIHPLRGQPGLRLRDWERGVALEMSDTPGMAVFYWFYEWNMFDAVAPGQHTQGTFHSSRTISPDRTQAVLELPGLRLSVGVVLDGAELQLRVANNTAHAWPALAGIIPCLSPGRLESAARTPAASTFYHVPLNTQLADPDRQRTYFLARQGLLPLTSRDIHFCEHLRATVDRASDQGRFVFTSKWPTSEVNAVAGLLIRESMDGQWVTGVGWEDFLSVQGHNPWNCLHACVRVGPLAPGQTKTIRGKLYLLRGSRSDCLQRFRKDFPSQR